MYDNYFEKLPKVESFQATSTDVENEQPLKIAQLSGILGMEGANDTSPQLSWSGAPANTKSYAVTMYDMDAPTGSGFWHWAVANIPVNITDLVAGAGDDTGSGLPDGAIQLPNDARVPRYTGAAPAPGSGTHRYLIVVHALDVENIGVAVDATPAFLGMLMAGHVLGRAILVATAKM